MLSEASACEGGSEKREGMLIRVTHLITQDFRVDHVGGPDTLVWGQEDLDVSAACCSREHHIQLTMRKDQDPKVSANVSNRLALGLVDGDQKCQMHQELATLQLEQKCCVVFGWQECDSRDELGLPVVVAPDYFDLQYPVRHPLSSMAAAYVNINRK